jgi:hypothetical protein
LSGRILDATTGLGIQGATATVLKPGSDGAAFLADPLAGASQVIAVGRTDEFGEYTFDRLLTEGEYPLIVRADGYPATIWTLTVNPGEGESIGDINITRASP